MKSSPTQIGGRAEDQVADELANQGYEILDKNWKIKIAEIDIVAKKDNTIYFVEVKYRQTDSAGDGFDYITDKKLHQMTRAAEAWVSQENWNGQYELMAVSVVGDQIDIRQIA